MTDRMKFSQHFIGLLSSIQAAGWIAGALVYGLYFQHLSIKRLLNLSIAAGVLATLLFLLLAGPISAAVANFSYGGSQMLAMVATLGLAADYCPKGAEGFAFAALMSVTNIAGSLAHNISAVLYVHAIRHELYSLILVAGRLTALKF